LALFLWEENYDKKSVKNNRKIKEEFKDKLKKSREEDVFAGFTTKGPHRDDIDIKIKNYTTIKKEYEKLEKKFIDCTHPKEEKNNEWAG